MNFLVCILVVSFMSYLGSTLCITHNYDKVHILPNTVDTLCVDAYMGRWYQMYSSLIPNVTFEKNGYCVTADYILNTTHTEMPHTVQIDVYNSQRLDNPSTGKLGTSNTIMVNYKFNIEPGMFLIKVGQDLVPYWILALGDSNDTTGKVYPWAIVSNPLRSMLFILARDVEVFESEYEEEVLKEVKKRGFIYPYNRPIKTFQSVNDCFYAPAPDVPK